LGENSRTILRSTSSDLAWCCYYIIHICLSWRRRFRICCICRAICDYLYSDYKRDSSSLVR